MGKVSLPGVRMQRTIFIGIILIIIIFGVIINQTPKESGDGYNIVFDEMPDIRNEGIYYNNAEIGHITSILKGSKGITVLTVTLDKALVQDLGMGVVFFPDHGILNAFRIKSTTAPLPEDFVFCGFSSEAGLKWFKLRTIFSNRISSASRRALKLFRKSGLS
jgi:hypothetical protein